MLTRLRDNIVKYGKRCDQLDCPCGGLLAQDDRGNIFCLRCETAPNLTPRLVMSR